MCHGIGVCSCGLFNRQMTSSHDLCCYLDSSVLFNHLTATVITAFATDCVIYVPRAAVRAKCDCRHLSLVVSTALRSARLRLFAFRMCHRFFISYLLLFFSGLQAGLFILLFGRVRLSHQDYQAPSAYPTSGQSPAWRCHSVRPYLCYLPESHRQSLQYHHLRQWQDGLHGVSSVKRS